MNQIAFSGSCCVAMMMALSGCSAMGCGAMATGDQGGDSTMCGGMMGGGMMGGGMMDDRKYPTNGETIFRTGKDLQGAVVQDIAKSMMKMPHSCEMCHGADGRGGMMMMGRMVPSIRFADLADPAKHRVPYTDALVRRFLDQELKSDGTAAQTGVAWKMSVEDENDLIAFLRSL